MSASVATVSGVQGNGSCAERRGRRLDDHAALLGATHGFGNHFEIELVARDVERDAHRFNRRPAQTQRCKQRRVDPKVGACGSNGNPEVDFDEVRHNCRQQRHDQQLARHVGRVGAEVGVKEGCGHDVDEQAKHQSGGEGHAKETQLVRIIKVETNACRQRRGKEQGKEEDRVPAIDKQPQPAQRPVEDRDEDGQIGQETQKTRDHQAVPRLVVRAIGAGVARFHLRQVGGVELVEGHPHRLGAVAHERTQEVHPVGLAIRPHKRGVGCHQF